MNDQLPCESLMVVPIGVAELVASELVSTEMVITQFGLADPTSVGVGSLVARQLGRTPTPGCTSSIAPRINGANELIANSFDV